MDVIFDQTKVPRTLSKAEWKQVYRSVRLLRLKGFLIKESWIQQLQVYGDRMPIQIKRDIIDKLVNPPLLLGPYQW